MFEKEAEEYIKEHTFFDEEYGVQSLDVVSKTIFKDGAEFGYNKANEWLYPSKGEYPKDEKEVLVYMWGSFYIGSYKQYTDDNNAWHFNDFDEESEQITAWKEIVPPSEPMRSLNKEEQKNYTEAINKVYKPTGVKLFDKEKE